MSGQDGPLAPVREREAGRPGLVWSSWPHDPVRERERLGDQPSSGHHGSMTPSGRERRETRSRLVRMASCPCQGERGGETRPRLHLPARWQEGYRALRDGVSQVSAGSSVTVPSATAIPWPSPESVRGR